MWAKTALLMLLISAFAVSPPAAQNGDAGAEAGAAYDAKDWAKAARLYGELVKEHPEVPRLWFRLADSQQQLGQLDQALVTIENGLKAGAPPIFAEFLIGSIYAQKNDKEKAFEHPKIAADNGYNRPELFDEDRHLDWLRSDEYDFTYIRKK
jgi:tetratricopeptide (TPR) repeat protein